MADVTQQADFDRLVTRRLDVWAVVFCTGKPDATWAVAASKLKSLVRLGRVDCARVAETDGNAAAPCARAAKRKKSGGARHVLGYSFTAAGEADVSTSPFVGSFNDKAIVKWALELAPQLAMQLTAHAGVNVLHKEELGGFLKRRGVAKAIFFTTSPKGKPPALVAALAVRFRQRILVGEVKASDMTLRNAFSVTDLPALVVVDEAAKRHKYEGVFKREQIEAFLTSFATKSPVRSLHNSEAPQTQRVKVKKQSYSDTETQEYPKGFDPWKALDLPRSRSVPSTESLKAAYRTVAKQWHPDKCRVGKQKCEKRMSEAALANRVLADARQLQHWEAWRDDGLKKKRRGHREL